LSAFPALAASPEDALVLVWGEPLLRLKAGEALGFEDLRCRFPQYADSLALQFDLERHIALSLDPPTLNDSPTLPTLAWPGELRATAS
jgi:hypothetical protein